MLLFPKDKAYRGSLNALHRESSVKATYKVLDTFELNTHLLDFYKSLKQKLQLYIFTTETIQDSPELAPYLQPIFKKVYSASRMNTSKREVSAYKAIANDLNLQPKEILYVDDNDTNIEAATKAGLQAIHYESNKQLINKLNLTLR